MTFDICKVHRICKAQLGKGVSGTPKNANILHRGLSTCISTTDRSNFRASECWQRGAWGFVLSATQKTSS